MLENSSEDISRSFGCIRFSRTALEGLEKFADTKFLALNSDRRQEVLQLAEHYNHVELVVRLNILLSQKS